MLKLFRDKITQDFMKTSIGNILEWYDFTIYGLFALQIAKAFFPEHSQFVGLLFVFLSFAIGFVARPIGSFFFGYLGDVKGKHYAVNLSIWCMAIPTAMIGLVPNYHMIGSFAPIILILLRIIQGLSVGGQFSGLIAIAVDSKHKRKAFLVSLVNSIAVIGCFIASLVGFLSVEFFGFLKKSSTLVNGLEWRVPFLMSFFVFLIYLKLKPAFKKHEKDPLHQFSFKAIFKRQPQEVFYAICVGMCLGTIYYTLFTYLVTYMETRLGMSNSLSLLIMNIMMACSIMLYPIFGYHADYSRSRLGAAKKQALFFLFAIGLFFLTPFNKNFVFLSWAIMLVSFCALSAYTMSLFGQLFPNKYRMSACSITYNMGFGISGFAPFLSEIFTKKWYFGLQYFLLSIAIILWVTLYKLSSTQGYKEIEKEFLQ